MNPINKALDEIRFRIPKQILETTFFRHAPLNCSNRLSLDAIIRSTVLEPRVMVDIDIRGGTEAYISMQSPVVAERVDPFTYIYNIPDELIHNRPIAQVYSVHFGYLGYQGVHQSIISDNSIMSSATRRVFDSAAKTPPAMTSYLNLIAPNTVMVRYITHPSTVAYLHLRLGNDNALSHLRPQSYHDFADLCVLAVKAYIYNHMLIIIDEAQIQGGQQLGVFRDKVSEYADAEELYREKLDRWTKISIMNDPEASRRLNHSLVIGGV